MSNKTVNTSGKRKRATARATIREGKGKVRVNHMFLNTYSNHVARLKIMEPFLIADKLLPQVDIDVNVIGGGQMAQAEAVRLAISRALVEYTKNEKLRQMFIEYDRNLLVADTRRKETCKPNDSKARAARQKSYR